MKKTLLIFSTICMLLVGCCPYDESDVQFSTQETDLISIYKVGDSLTFINSKDSIQKWFVLEIDTLIKTGCFIEGTDHSITLTLTNNQKGENTADKNHIYLSKYPGGIKGIKTSLSIFFEDFSGDIDSEDSLKSTPFTTINLRGFNIPNIFEIESKYMERKTQPLDITHVYWSKKFGLAAFKTYDGEIWIKRKWLSSTYSPPQNHSSIKESN